MLSDPAPTPTAPREELSIPGPRTPGSSLTVTVLSPAGPEHLTPTAPGKSIKEMQGPGRERMMQWGRGRCLGGPLGVLGNHAHRSEDVQDLA